MGISPSPIVVLFNYNRTSVRRQGIGKKVLWDVTAQLPRILRDIFSSAMTLRVRQEKGIYLYYPNCGKASI